MSKDALSIVRSLAEAYTGPVAKVLAKYRLLGPDGEIREAVRNELATGRELERGPIIDQDVLGRLLALDPSRSKSTFDWMLFASAGGEDYLKTSAEAMAIGKSYAIASHMKGEAFNENGTIERSRPMTAQEAEDAWQAEDFVRFETEYFYGSQDLASDPSYPIFGWYMHWPGRNGIYEEVVSVVAAWTELVTDRKFLQSWQEVSPQDKFQTTLIDGGGNPLFKNVKALAQYVKEARPTLVRRRAEKNTHVVSKKPVVSAPSADPSADPSGGGSKYSTGTEGVFYEDEFLKVMVPLNAAASLKHGFNDWCVANRTRWKDYFDKRDQTGLLWAGDLYAPKGPFAFFTFKKHMEKTELTRFVGWPVSNTLPKFPMLAAHVQISAAPGAPDRINFWDMRNAGRLGRDTIDQRLQAEYPEAQPSFTKAIAELEEWLKEFKMEQLELLPALEALATQLVASLLEA